MVLASLDCIGLLVAINQSHVSSVPWWEALGSSFSPEVDFSEKRQNALRPLKLRNRHLYGGQVDQKS